MCVLETLSRMCEDGNHSQVEANVYKCLVSVLEIGLACSMASPKERMNIEEVSKELHSIKNAFLGSRI